MAKTLRALRRIPRWTLALLVLAAVLLWAVTSPELTPVPSYWDPRP